MRKRHIALSTVLVVVAGAAVAVTVPALAGTGTPPSSIAEVGDGTTGVDEDLAAAMRRDLRLSADQVGSRIRRERWAATTESSLRRQVGTRFGGAWLTPGADTLVVAVTDEEAAGTVKAAGAEPRLVSTTESELNQLKGQLDAGAQKVSPLVAGWYVDVTTSSVVVVAKPGGEAAARALVAASGIPTGTVATAVRIVTADESPQPLYDVRGADAYYINSSARCSIGFSVQGGFVSAGHCGKAGATTAGSNRVAQGTFQASSFPGNDYSWVAVNSNWTPTGVVNDYNGGTIPVYGSQEAVVGASICRSGSTTGTRCGVVQAKNATVNYSQGTVSGLTRTNVCAEAGDSGGSWLSGNQAQGVTSGGSGNCTSGGTTYFQPVNEILSAYGLTLVTSGQGSPSPTTPATTRPTTTPPTTTPPTTTPPATTAPATRPPTTSQPPVTGACSASYRQVNSWTGGFQGEVTVQAGTTAINGWTVGMSFPGGTTITQLWNGTLSGTGPSYTVKSVSWNGSISANGSTVFGFLGGGTAATPSLTCTSP